VANGTKVYTVGHSTRPIGELVALLTAAGVRLLVDVRRFPVSRRYPHFSGPALRASLSEAGIDYRHEVALGGHREPRPDSPNKAWRASAFRGYADHMATAGFAAGLERLEKAAAARPTAVMCAEADPARCHRQLLADALTLRGAQVVHLLGPGRMESHEVHPAARITPRGGIVYG